MGKSRNFDSPVLFQSTPPHGERPWPPGADEAGHKSFNPRPRTGSDPTRDKQLVSQGRFQSTPPHGERPTDRLYSTRKAISFNPRPRTGSDL